MPITFISKNWLFLSVLILFIGCGTQTPRSPRSSLPVSSSSPTVIYSAHPKPLRDSKWGKIAQFQNALNQQLKKCRLAEIEVNGRFDTQLKNGIERFYECQNTPSSSQNSRSYLIDTAFFSSLVSSGLPSVHERAFVLSLSHEATDYDQMEWNYNTSDDRSILTWGPYGATVGYGSEVIGILKKVEENHPGLIEKAFGGEINTLRLLLQSHSTDKAYQLLKPIYADLQKRNFWKEAFRRLGAEITVRETYEEYALQSNQWLKPALKRLYQLIPKSQATEIDYAFFLDIAMHMGISSKRIEEAKQAIIETEKNLGRALKPAERRQVISKTLVPNQRQNDRLGRNVVYYVDGIGEAKLSTAEYDAWKNRSGRKASQVGLTEKRYDPIF